MRWCGERVGSEEARSRVVVEDLVAIDHAFILGRGEVLCPNGGCLQRVGSGKLLPWQPFQPYRQRGKERKSCRHSSPITPEDVVLDARNPSYRTLATSAARQSRQTATKEAKRGQTRRSFGVALLALVEVSMSRQPAKNMGLLATIPTGCPSILANPTVMFLAQSGMISKYVLSSTTCTAFINRKKHTRVENKESNEGAVSFQRISQERESTTLQRLPAK